MGPCAQKGCTGCEEMACPPCEAELRARGSPSGLLPPHGQSPAGSRHVARTLESPVLQQFLLPKELSWPSHPFPGLLPHQQAQQHWQDQVQWGKCKAVPGCFTAVTVSEKNLGKGDLGPGVAFLHTGRQREQPGVGVRKAPVLLREGPRCPASDHARPPVPSPPGC